MMNTIINKSVLIILVLSQLLFSQEKITLDTSNYFFLKGNNEFQLDDVFLLKRLNGFKSVEHFSFDSSTVWIQTKNLISIFNEGNTFPENYFEQLSSPLLTKYYESQKYAPLKIVLQSVQVGTIAYLAYLHFKKYGFLKKK